MRSPRSLSVVAALSIAMLLGSGISQASPTAQSAAPEIKLKAATFAPTRGQAPAIPPGLAIAGYAEGQRGYYLVQFNGPVEQAWKDQVTAAGADILDYVPEFAFKVRMNPAEARRVAQLSNVSWVDVFHPAYKLSPSLDRTGGRPLQVRVERGADAAAVAQVIAKTGATVLGREGQMLLVAANGVQADAIAQVLDVAWVDTFHLWEKHDATTRVIIGANAANSSDGVEQSRGYDGSTQIAAVADTGIGDGSANPVPSGINGRVKAVYNWPGTTDVCFQRITDDKAQDVDSGHGSHVASSVLSDGTGSPSGINNRGIAPAATLVFQATENWVTTSSFCKNFYGYQDGYYLTGLPADLRTLFQQAYDAGARIHANSWGSAAAGDYTANSASADDFIWTHRDMTITFSAGNEGADANTDGIVDSDSIGAPATAKNVITIGASENQWSTAVPDSQFPCDTTRTYRSQDSYQKKADGTGYTCTEMGGKNLIGTGGSRWEFNAEPLKSDPTAGNQNQMALFSSRGPTDDGRIKPDVVAPGSMILSGYSGMYQEGYSTTVNPQNNAFQWDGYGMPINGAYKWMGGTSMSNPIAAGAATVVRDYYNKAKKIDASAALVKATLINSSVDLLDENNDGANDNDFPIPNVHEGWGLVNINTGTDGTAQFRDVAAGLATGASTSYTTSATGGPLKVTLVWSDFASTESATKNLVNDLDLTVTAPDGTTVYRGNVFGGGWSKTGGTADRINNVENVYIPSATGDNWKIEVRGFNVPNGPQPFALVVDGASPLNEGSATPTPTGLTAPSGLTATAISKTQINLKWIDNTTNETGFKIERCTGANCTNFTQVTTAGANTISVTNSGLTRNTTYRYRIRAYNATGDSAYSTIASATTSR